MYFMAFTHLNVFACFPSVIKSFLNEFFWNISCQNKCELLLFADFSHNYLFTLFDLVVFISAHLYFIRLLL